MQFDKEKFLKTELGIGLVECITEWDTALIECNENACRAIRGYTIAKEKYIRNLETVICKQARWEVYQMAIEQFYGIEYHFTRTEHYFGICTEDEFDWLFKVEREL